MKIRFGPVWRWIPLAVLLAAGPARATLGALSVNQEPPRKLDAAHPLKVWVGGDSLSLVPGGELSQILGPTGVVTCKIDSMNSTGLTHTTVRDWLHRFKTVINTWNPDIVIVMMGASDPQPLNISGKHVDFGAPEWQTEYARRVGKAMDTLRSGGRMVLWVGMPVMRGDRPIPTSAHMAILNRLFMTEAATRPEVDYVDSWKLFSTPSGSYTEALPGTLPLRAPDGIHFSYAGANRLARVLFEQIDERWHVSPFLKPAGPPTVEAVLPKAILRANPVVLKARLVKVTRSPNPGVIAPYRSALVIDEYRVERVLTGKCRHRLISVAHWGILDAAVVKSNRRRGRTYRLVLGNFDEQPGMDSQPRFPDSDRYPGGLYFELSTAPTLNPLKAPAPGLQAAPPTNTPGPIPNTPDPIPNTPDPIPNTPDPVPNISGPNTTAPAPGTGPSERS